MANFLYVDNSNVWIEGMYLSAVLKEQAPDLVSAHKDKICDQTWTIDYGRLLSFAGGETSEIGRAVLYGSRPPANDSLWAAAESKGFQVIVHERSPSGREKKLDTNIATDIVADSFQLMKPEHDVITLVAGDGDYVPVVENVCGRGFNFSLVFWEHATSRELIEVCSHFTALDPHLEHLRLTENSGE